MTSFVNADTTVAGRLLGLAPGRSGACVKAWVEAQTQAFPDGIELVVIDPSAPYASGVRAARSSGFSEVLVVGAGLLFPGPDTNLTQSDGGSGLRHR